MQWADGAVNGQSETGRRETRMGRPWRHWYNSVMATGSRHLYISVWLYMLNVYLCPFLCIWRLFSSLSVQYIFWSGCLACYLDTFVDKRAGHPFWIVHGHCWIFLFIQIVHILYIYSTRLCSLFICSLFNLYTHVFYEAIAAALWVWPRDINTHVPYIYINARNICALVDEHPLPLTPAAAAAEFGQRPFGAIPAGSRGAMLVSRLMYSPCIRHFLFWPTRLYPAPVQQRSGASHFHPLASAEPLYAVGVMCVAVSSV